MADEPRTSVSIRSFAGMSTDSDPNGRQPGLAVESVNTESHDPGVLRSRRGIKAVEFEGE